METRPPLNVNQRKFWSLKDRIVDSRWANPLPTENTKGQDLQLWQRLQSCPRTTRTRVDILALVIIALKVKTPIAMVRIAGLYRRLLKTSRVAIYRSWFPILILSQMSGPSRTNEMFSGSCLTGGFPYGAGAASPSSQAFALNQHHQNALGYSNYIHPYQASGYPFYSHHYQGSGWAGSSTGTSTGSSFHENYHNYPNYHSSLEQMYHSAYPQLTSANSSTSSPIAHNGSSGSHPANNSPTASTPSPPYSLPATCKSTWFYQFAYWWTIFIMISINRSALLFLY